MLFADSKLRGEMKLTHSTFFKTVADGRTSTTYVYLCSSLRIDRNKGFESEKYRQCGHYPSRIGSSTPRPRAKNHNAGAGVPTGRSRRSSRAANRGSRISQRV